jgi:hypothetical protein
MAKMEVNNRSTRFVQRRAMPKITAILATSMILAGPGLTRAMAASNLDSNVRYIGLDPSTVQLVSDSEMGQMRGRFVPAGGGSEILYFGLVMESNVTQNGNSATAGLAFGVNFKTGTPNVVTDQTWATQSGTGVQDAIPGDSSSKGLQGIAGGIGQEIQISGSDNQAGNQADIVVTHNTPGDLLPGGVPTGAACGSACISSIQSNALKVSVDMGGAGSAIQTIGPSAILQGIQLNGDMAQATNSMSMVIQMTQATGINVLGVSTVLNSIPTLSR